MLSYALVRLQVIWYVVPSPWLPEQAIVGVGRVGAGVGVGAVVRTGVGTGVGAGVAGIGVLVGVASKFARENKKDRSLELIEFCLFDDETAKLFARELENLL